MNNKGTHGTLLLIVGGYICWMGSRMLANTKAGLSSMSMTTTKVLMALMFIGGAAVILYGIGIFWGGWKDQRRSYSDEPENAEEIQQTEITKENDE